VDQDIKLDFQRAQRLGLEEAIYCAGKSVGQIARILDHAEARNARLLLTRLHETQFVELPEHYRAKLDYEPISRSGFFGPPVAVRGEPHVAIVVAGTSDLFVSREAVRTLAYYGVPALEVTDVGVAGLWRLLERVEEIRRMAVVLVVAGMDAALPTVVGGLVPSLVIGVPTSVGYGVATGGQSALNAILASCAPGVAAVNIDNGYGAACAALRALRMAGLISR
jgi:NCAIR mutase (PurE)-related protein